MIRLSPARLIAGGLLPLLVACAGLPAPPAVPEPSLRQQVLVIAHRGAHLQHPPNSLEAIRAAIELGCDYVELDVRQSRDGALVLMHDPHVDKTTDGEGAVADLTLADLRALRLDNGEPVPTFAEALACCAGKIGVYVDHKGGPDEEIVAQLREHGLLQHAVIYGGDDDLRQVKRLAPEMGLLAPHPSSEAGMRRLMQDLHPGQLDSHMRSWSLADIRLAHELGAEVWVDVMHEWDSDEGYRTAVAMGVDAMQTDYPGDLLAVLRELGRR